MNAPDIDFDERQAAVVLKHAVLPNYISQLRAGGLSTGSIPPSRTTTSSSRRRSRRSPTIRLSLSEASTMACSTILVPRPARRAWCRDGDHHAAVRVRRQNEDAARMGGCGTDHRIHMLDADQSVRPADLPASATARLTADAQSMRRLYPLMSQTRARAGTDYVGYVRALLGVSKIPPRTAVNSIASACGGTSRPPTGSTHPAPLTRWFNTDRTGV